MEIWAHLPYFTSGRVGYKLNTIKLNSFSTAFVVKLLKHSKFDKI